MHKWHVGWPRKFLRVLGSNQAIKQEKDEHPHKGLKSTIHDIPWYTWWVQSHKTLGPSLHERLYEIDFSSLHNNIQQITSELDKTKTIHGLPCCVPCKIIQHPHYNFCRYWLDWDTLVTYNQIIHVRKQSQ